MNVVDPMSPAVPAMTCTSTSAAPRTSAAATPPRRPWTTAHDSTAAATQDTGSVGRPAAMLASVSTHAVASTQPAATARSAAGSAGPRRRGLPYARYAYAVQAVMTPRTAQPPAGRA